MDGWVEHGLLRRFFYFHVQVFAASGDNRIKAVNPIFGQQVMFNLVDGLIRIAMFLLFVWGVPCGKTFDASMSITARSTRQFLRSRTAIPLNSATVQKYSTYHPRCGTSFLMTVMIISMLVYMAIPVHTFWARFGIRIALLPLIAASLTRLFALPLSIAARCLPL